jgi:hypothetical protein
LDSYALEIVHRFEAQYGLIEVKQPDLPFNRVHGLQHYWQPVRS